MRTLPVHMPTMSSHGGQERGPSRYKPLLLSPARIAPRCPPSSLLRFLLKPPKLVHPWPGSTHLLMSLLTLMPAPLTIPKVFLQCLRKAPAPKAWPPASRFQAPGLLSAAPNWLLLQHRASSHLCPFLSYLRKEPLEDVGHEDLLPAGGVSAPGGGAGGERRGPLQAGVRRRGQVWGLGM